MYLISYGTRPEMIKVLPLIKKFSDRNVPFKTLFSGQHINLFDDFKTMLPIPEFILDDVMEHGQTLNKLSSKILSKVDVILRENTEISHIVIQGDTSTAYSIALAGFHHKKQIVHLEAGLRTHDKYSPFPEEINRSLISRIADIHLCPTEIAVENLLRENIDNNVYNVGNTIVDIFKYIMEDTEPPIFIKELLHNLKSKKQEFIIITLHRRENRGEKMKSMWDQINRLSVSEPFKDTKFIYITHPAIPEVRENLHENIILLEPLDYISMVHLIKNCKGIITDSGGIQEEAVCANKRVIVCRDTTERPETINSGFGKLVDTNISDNIDFILNNDSLLNTTNNPYGNNVCDKIMDKML